MSGNIRVKMVPTWLSISGHAESGIKTVVKHYFEYLPEFGIDLVHVNDDEFDLIAVHAGMSNKFPVGTPYVSHCHGLYWTADYAADSWEFKSNREVINSLRVARKVTVPTEWVAQNLRRDMHISPQIVPHGINWKNWEHNNSSEGYILWNKNRMGDVCDPSTIRSLAIAFPEYQFLSTFSYKPHPQNLKVIGTQPHNVMRNIVQRAGIYLATTKETFGIGILEAMASGVPVLAYDHGGVSELVTHGETGYLAQPDNLEDLAEGLSFCMRYRETLGENAKFDVRQYGWRNVAEQIARIYREAVEPVDPTVSVVIPCYNKEATLERAVVSCLSQTYQPVSIVIVNDGSSDGSIGVARRLREAHKGIISIREQPNLGVAHARNTGVRATNSTYVCCLDADDEIAPDFLRVCVEALHADPSLGVAYTKLRYIPEVGNSVVSEWPGEYDFDQFLRRKNQVPTCAVYRRDLFDRLGGYRQRYAPRGAGAEDAEFWLRMGAIGYAGKLVTGNAEFLYHGGGATSDKEYREPDWLSWHPWTKDGMHPFASIATPVQFSHPVRQYDQPHVSVIIPCGPNHTQYLVDALDSLESQMFRQWEAIVICDGFSVPESLQVAYPFVHWVESTQRGPGAARNLGVKLAKSQRILFLDADDWLMADAISEMMNIMNQSDGAVYSDYYALASISNPAELAPSIKLLDTNPKSGLSLLSFQAGSFDKQKALRQPENPPYVWCNITTLIKKEWHEAIGGFDESLISWEDVDYWWRMAESGVQFHRIQQPLMTYRFSTGNRRELGLELWTDLLKTLSEKRMVSDARV